MAIFSMFFLVFGVMGFISNLFVRVIWLYCEWHEGNEIDWQRQVMMTFAVPGAYLFVMIELMLVEGFVFVA